MIGNKIKTARKEKYWSQQALSTMLSDDELISQRAISKWESGKSDPSLKSLRKLTKVLGRPASWFLDEEPEKVIKFYEIEKIKEKNDIIETPTKKVDPMEQETNKKLDVLIDLMAKQIEISQQQTEEQRQELSELKKNILETVKTTKELAGICQDFVRLETDRKYTKNIPKIK